MQNIGYCLQLTAAAFLQKATRCTSVRPRLDRMRGAGMCAVVGMLLQLPLVCSAATSANANSPLGINLVEMSYFNGEQPFLNAFKTSGTTTATPDGWWTHNGGTFETNEEAYLQLDANGYPTTLTASSADPNHPQIFNSVGVLLFRGLGPANAGTGARYRAGKYVVLYDGQGTLQYNLDASLVSSSPGRDVINVTPTNLGIDLRIIATDPNHTGNYLRNIRVVMASEESALTAGNVFEPYFLSMLQNFHVIRAMQWLNIDGPGGDLQNWSSRPHVSDAGWGSTNGVPLEIVLQLCNTVGADCWLNVPHQANDDYITQMATLAHSTLNTTQKIYIEFSNEVWNSYPQGAYALAQGQAMWPTANVSASWQYKLNWYGMRAAQTCDIWRSVWGSDASRVVCVMGAQDGNWGTAQTALDCPLWVGSGNAPCAAHGINAVAYAPYFDAGYQAPTSWLSAPDHGLSQLFQQINSVLPGISANDAGSVTNLKPYNLPLIAYEGGQSLVTSNPGLLSLYIAANRDARMGAAYTAALNNWRNDGGQLYVLYSDLAIPNQFGEFGALESFLDSTFVPTATNPLPAGATAAPPKWQAIQNFIAANPCWWSGCAGTIGASSAATPVAPVLSVK